MISDVISNSNIISSITGALAQVRAPRGRLAAAGREACPRGASPFCSIISQTNDACSHNCNNNSNKNKNSKNNYYYQHFVYIYEK